MKSHQIAIQVKDVSKTFKLPHEQQNSIKGRLINFNKRGFEVQQALKNISFDVKKGEFFGIVGRNGSGKSTLLKILAGIYTPDSGTVQINGRLTPFIELGVGFNPELSGRDNVFLNGALLGFTRKEMEQMYDDIVAFAEIERFMDQKLKNYSSGMQVRLAFSIAIRANTDILVLDEVLAVGDINFQKKCIDYFTQLKAEGKTVILVSHDAATLQQFCDRGILIDDSQLITESRIDHVINRYTDILSKEKQTTEANTPSEHIGTGKALITTSSIEALGSTRPRNYLTEADEKVVVDFTIEARESLRNVIFGLTFYDEMGQVFFAINNMWSKKELYELKRDKKYAVTWVLPNIFSTGKYTATPAITTDKGYTVHDLVEEGLSFEVRKKQISNTPISFNYELRMKAITEGR